MIYFFIKSSILVLSVVLSGGAGGGSGSRRSLLWLQVQRQPVLRHFSPGTFLWHHKFLHFLWPALGGYKGRTWPVIVCLALSSVGFLMLLVTSSRARLSDCLRIQRSLRSAPWTNKNCSLFVEWSKKKSEREEETKKLVSSSFRLATRVSLAPTLWRPLCVHVLFRPSTSTHSHSQTCWYLLFVEIWGRTAEKKGLGEERQSFFFSFFWREGGPETLSAHINLTLSSAGLREARTIHTPAWQHSWRLKRSGVTQWPHPANQFQGTNSGPLFLLYVFALVEQTLSLMLQCALCSLIDWIGTEHFYVC